MDWKISPLVKEKIFDKFKREFTVLNKKNKKVDESKMTLNDAVNSQVDGELS